MDEKNVIDVEDPIKNGQLNFERIIILKKKLSASLQTFF